MTFQLLSNNVLTLMALMLIHGTALMLLTWLADTTLLRRSRPSIHAALWTVVLIKFLLPPVLPVNFGLSGMIDSLLPQTQRALTAAPQKVDATWRGDESAGERESRRPDAPQRHTQRFPPSYLPALLLFSYAGLLSWLSGKTLIHARRTGRRVRRLPAAHASLTAEVSALARGLGLRRPPRVRLDGGAASPFVIGAWSPTLVMPPALAGQVNPSVREALIIHELAHIRRGDVLVRLLQNLARLLFFFWPPVWWLCRRLDRYSEMACDQWAVKYSSASPQLYAESLLVVAKGVRSQALLSHEVGFAAPKARLMLARFKMILEGGNDKSPRLSWRMLAALVGWGFFALTGNVWAKPEGDAVITNGSPRVNHAEHTNRGDGAGAVSSLNGVLSTEGQEAGQEPRRGSEKERERRRAEEQRARSESRAQSATPAPASRAAEEVMAYQQSRVRGLDQSPTATEIDLDGDGKISPFESGYSAGARHAARRMARDKTSPGQDSVRDDRPADATAERRREIELRAQRLKRHTANQP
ncbi:MAG TPA: M56 family metallopeptidase [Pyrinomonadaceae bacterium]|jgi:beta-lactamase regulating signal transducer with metallopeptidase domain|nr:M56 family metallopeptidase [Pyrinomonadaceae bacterium]